LTLTLLKSWAARAPVAADADDRRPLAVADAAMDISSPINALAPSDAREHYRASNLRDVSLWPDSEHPVVADKVRSLE
jgi:hypothetical protein